MSRDLYLIRIYRDIWYIIAKWWWISSILGCRACSSRRKRCLMRINTECLVVEPVRSWRTDAHQESIFWEIFLIQQTGVSILALEVIVSTIAFIVWLSSLIVLLFLSTPKMIYSQRRGAINTVRLSPQVYKQLRTITEKEKKLISHTIN